MALIAVIIGIIFTFFVPGYVIIETFFSKIRRILKFPLYILTSLLVSTYSVYLMSLLFGYSKLTILLTFLVFAVVLVFYEIRKGIRFKFLKEHKNIFIFAIFVLIVYFTALNAGFFTRHDDYIVMSAENWQDTAMHMGITESITQGNFPPTAPYFSGHDLTYYYFVDFHASIIETLSGEFMPQIFVYLNPIYIFLLIISVYSLAYTVTKNKVLSLFASILISFFGNFMFVYYLSDLLRGGDTFQLLVNKGYNGDFFGIMNVSSMADYFLQNRPMMIGLPAFAISLNLILINLKKNNLKVIFLVGIISSLMVKFQFFATIAIILTLFLFVFSLFIKKEKVNKILKIIGFFMIGLLPGIFLIVFLRAGNSGFVDLIQKTFEYKAFASDKSILWKLQFIFENFGIQIVLFILTIVLMVRRKIHRTWEILFISFLGIVLFLTPFLIRFTIYDFDMMKFFYLSLIPISIVASIYLYRLWQRRSLRIIVILVLFFASLTSILNIGWSYFNKNMAYSLSEYEVGLWIRNYTPQKSVFMQMPVVHSAVSEIGGRTRVLSYITWPYSHGFNEGADNVFSRLDDIKSFYNNPNAAVLRKYDVNYVYLGTEEINNYPNTRELLEMAKFVTKVYEGKDITIYRTNI